MGGVRRSCLITGCRMTTSFSSAVLKAKIFVCCRADKLIKQYAVTGSFHSCVSNRIGIKLMHRASLELHMRSVVKFNILALIILASSGNAGGIN